MREKLVYVNSVKQLNDDERYFEDLPVATQPNSKAEHVSRLVKRGDFRGASLIYSHAPHLSQLLKILSATPDFEVLQPALLNDGF